MGLLPSRHGMIYRGGLIPMALAKKKKLLKLEEKEGGRGTPTNVSYEKGEKQRGVRQWATVRNLFFNLITPVCQKKGHGYLGGSS